KITREERLAQIALRDRSHADTGNQQRAGSLLGGELVGGAGRRHEPYPLPAPSHARDTGLEIDARAVDVGAALFLLAGDFERELLESRIADGDRVARFETLPDRGGFQLDIEPMTPAV